MGDSLHTNVPVINKFRPISSFRNANWAMGKVQGTSRRGGRGFRPFRDSFDGKIWTRWEFQAIAVLIAEHQLRDLEMDRVALF